LVESVTVSSRPITGATSDPTLTKAETGFKELRGKSRETYETNLGDLITRDGTEIGRPGLVVSSVFRTC
jgi:hypothetical protein